MPSLHDPKLDPSDQEKLDVLAHQQRSLGKLDNEVDRTAERVDESIREAEKLAGWLGISTVPEPSRSSRARKMPTLRSWDEVVAEAERTLDGPALFSDLLSSEEIARVEQRIAFLRGDFDSIHRLDKIDWAISGVAGILAALVDMFLIWMPRHAGFLGGKASVGGPLANWIRDLVKNSLSPEDIGRLERQAWVPFDTATSQNLHIPIGGLSPSMHRFQSPGHDPVLGFIFGVADILRGTFTAIDSHGRLIVQPVSVQDPATLTMNLFEAIGREFAHLKSDVATARGLPVPLMPLFQFLQFGRIGKRGYTVSEISRIMYRSGYDFRHFLAMSVSPLLIEVIVRLCYFAKRGSEGHTLEESVPFELPLGGRLPKLNTMLFAAHFVSTAANAGKLAITQNPLTLNYSQWMAFFYYAVGELKWALLDSEEEKLKFVQETLDQTWLAIDQELENTWKQVAGGALMLS